MPIAPPSFFRFFRGTAVVLFLAWTAFFAPAQEEKKEAKAVELEDVPQRFFQVQDSNGFFWQAAGNGALTSGETQYLQSGLNLIVAGSAFAPSAAKVRAPDSGSSIIDIELSEKREALAIKRNLLFDTERGAVRALDSFSNTAGSTLNLVVSLRTTYPFAWQSLHGMNGNLLSSDPVLKLGPQDSGMVVHFSAAEGRHDTVLLLGSGEKALMPKLSGSTNRRELTLTYEIAIPAGESRSLFHWISQRSVPDMSVAENSFSDLFQQGRLVRPGVDAANQKVVNFSSEAFPDPSAAPAQLRALVALNRLLDQVGQHRRNTDLLWLSPSNQFTGEVSVEGPLLVNAAHVGKQEVSMADVAAIKGGAGIGRQPKVFLRDGRVLHGEITGGTLAIAVAESEQSIPIKFEDLALLLFRTKSNDGVAPAKAIGFLKLLDGSVLALNESADSSLSAVTSWGSEQIPFSEVTELQYVSLPGPSYRIVRSDQSRYSLFLHGEPVKVSVTGGEPLQFAPNEISEYWSSGNHGGGIDDLEEAWLSYEEVPGTPPGESSFLLAGSNLISGTFSSTLLTLRENGASIRIEAERIQSIRRNLELTESGETLFSVVLKSGDVLEGKIEDDYLNIEKDSGPIRIPREQFLAYRAARP